MKRAATLAAKAVAHLPGRGCVCLAWSSDECGCPEVDWRSRREVAAESAVLFCLQVLKRHHIHKPGIAALVRETQQILDASRHDPS